MSACKRSIAVAALRADVDGRDAVLSGTGRRVRRVPAATAWGSSGHRAGQGNVRRELRVLSRRRRARRRRRRTEPPAIVAGARRQQGRAHRSGAPGGPSRHAAVPVHRRTDCRRRGVPPQLSGEQPHRCIDDRHPDGRSKEGRGLRRREVRILPHDRGAHGVCEQARRPQDAAADVDHAGQHWRPRRRRRAHSAAADLGDRDAAVR